MSLHRPIIAYVYDTADHVQLAVVPPKVGSEADLRQADSADPARTTTTSAPPR